MPKKKSTALQLIPGEVIERRILLIPGLKVMLDADLAALYQVETFNLNKAVKRNADRFPSDLMFQLTQEEFKNLRFQLIWNVNMGRSSLPALRLHRTWRSHALSVLQSRRAVQVNIAIVRTFARLREILATHKELARRLQEMERKYDRQFKAVFDILRQLMEPPPEPPKEPIGFVSGKK